MRRFFVLLVLVLAAGCASNGSSRDALLRIVTDCLDTGAPRYCARCPSPQAGTCDLQYPCTRTTEVWAETGEYVAIRDLKMCGCPAGFVHGLAMPRYPVSGPEDPRRPEALWRFAWDVARSRISDEREIALLINPPALRTQDQLHIHLVRLLPDARARIDALKPDAIARLEEVWTAAAQHAAGRELTEYGVIVVQSLDHGWLVAADAGATEIAFTAARCGS
jgi:CDP-diacylglycerol pyrophosphatase